MARWQPDAPLRLQEAAMELFLEKGYETTTVEEIAQRAQLTRRTFFRYFADKREVLFLGSEAFETTILGHIRNQDAGDPLERVIAALQVMSKELFDSRADAVRRRWRVIRSSPELQERESKKLAGVVEKAAQLLATLGADETGAQFSSEIGMLVFRRAFDQWAGAGGKTLHETIRETAEVLRKIFVSAPSSGL